MDNRVIAYDLGTGGIKASLFTDTGYILGSVFVAYPTSHPKAGWQEQAPNDWWHAIVASTHQLLESTQVNKDTIRALAISGHSLGVVPIGREGQLLRNSTPIWSDMRATSEAEKFFESVDYENWYNTTGNGFPPACYSVFKLMWYKENEPEMFAQIHQVIGTKDYCNFRFTGRLCTDYSYASGTGVFDLQTWSYRNDFIAAAKLSHELFPQILPSDAMIGTITPEAAQETGLPKHVQVICGGVDNSCMALGAKGTSDSRVYTSLGSSAWIALVSHKPILDFKRKPYVFAHVIKGMYTSATCIFSAGTSQQWVRNICCQDLLQKAREKGEDAWLSVNQLIAESEPGARGMLFNPSLAGGSMLEPTPWMTGAFSGLKLEHSRADLLRATQEGIALNLRIALDLLRQYHPDMQSMLIVGGGAKSTVWMQIFADIYYMPVEKTTIDQEAASLGAAALALKGVGLWTDYSIIDQLHIVEKEYQPQVANKQVYEEALSRFKQLSLCISTLC